MRDVRFDPELFRNYMSRTVLDEIQTLEDIEGWPCGQPLRSSNRINFVELLQGS